MKTMKKFAALLLVVVLMAAMLIVPANAAGTGSITISDALDGVTYSLYKVLDLSHSGDAFSYTVNSNWTGFFTAVSGDSNDGLDFVTIENDYVTGLELSEAAAFAKAAEAYATGKSLSVDVKSLGTGETDIVFDGLEDGYYVVGTSLTGQVAFGTSVPAKDISNIIVDAIVVDEKNALPAISKTSDKAVAGIGDTVEYKITVNVEAVITENYVLDDNLAGGKLKLNEGSIVVKQGENTWVKDTDYTVSVTPAKLTISLDNDKLNALNAGDAVDITYKAEVVGYGNIDNVVSFKTLSDDAGSTNYCFDLVKTDVSKKVLSGAKFELYDALTGGKKIPLVKITEGYRVATTAEATAEGFVSAVIEAGQATVYGLKNGTYYLEETEAPEGYNKLSERKSVQINGADVKATVTGDTYESGGVQIENKTGGMFPSTGGIGTTIFYCIGGLLVLAAVVVLVTRRRVVEN